MFELHKNTKKKQILYLWKTIFEDSDKFTDLYFSRVYRDENAVVIEQGGQIVSALQMIPYTMTYFGEEIPVAYISGACTAPAARGKGLMRELLENAFEEMRRRGIALTALIPAEKWLFDYYRVQGYTEAFEFSLSVFTRHEYIEPATGLHVSPAERTPDHRLFEYFDRKLRERPACILHTETDFQTILMDLALSGGQCFTVATEDGRLAGMAFVLPPNETTTPGSVLMKEILCDNERVKRHLLYEITKRYDVLKAVYRTPMNNHHTTYPYGMARVIDSERMIARWMAAHPESGMTIDELRGMDIRTLTSLLFDYPKRTAYMSLMLD